MKKKEKNLLPERKGFELEFFGKYSWSEKQVRRFGSQKTMTQYIRRNNILIYKECYNGEYITYFGGTMVSLSKLQEVLVRISRPLPKKKPDTI